MTGTMEINEAQKCMDNDQPVIYHGNSYKVIGINKLNNTVTIAQGPIGKDVEVSELENERS